VKNENNVQQLMIEIYFLIHDYRNVFQNTKKKNKNKKIQNVFKKTYNENNKIY
jgi:hypothetical protein